MIKYIDKGTALQHLTDRLMESALNNVGIKVDADELFRDIAENRLPVWLDELPAADVQEVRRGCWIGTEHDGYADGYPVYYEWKCSVCGCVFEDEEPTYNYCPNCGARCEEV